MSNTGVPPQPPKQGGGGGGVVGLISQLMAFIDKPWKAAVVVVLLVIVGTGALIWDQRDVIVRRMLPKHPTTPVLMTLLDKQFTTLRRGTRANLVMIWSVNFGGNDVEFVAGQWGDGKVWRPDDFDLPDRLPAMVEEANAASVVDVLQGRVACTSTSDGWGLIVRHIRNEGYNRLCMIPVKPPKMVVIAIIILVWKQQLGKLEENTALQIAQDVADSTYQ